MCEEVCSEDETCINEQELFQIREEDTESNRCNEESALEISSENFPSVLSNQTLDERETIVPECELSFKPSCKEKQHLECGNVADCVQENIQNLDLDICIADYMHGCEAT